MSVRQIDIAALKANFRAACAPWGIDPVEGATSYQVVHVVAAQRLAEQARTCSDWWSDYTLWYAEDDDITRSATEEYVHASLAFHTYMDAAVAAGNAAQQPEADSGDLIPLREALAQRGERLQWIDLGDGEVVSIIRPARRGRYGADVRAAALRLRAKGFSLVKISAVLEISPGIVSRWDRQAKAATA
ncbi:MAG: hypothetical protein IPK17_38390 [Chloroflexi bacterium]|uniref:hypothetical protein n=1 Tax=Candidatus Flexifilum breve TaxID=3140694 RepID=UPI003136F8F9|nr:hypothetical protein [Chloroflexota bacterium]